MRGLDFGPQVADAAGGAGILQHHGERFFLGDGGGVAGGDIDQGHAERPGAGGEHGAGLRMQVAGNQQGVGLRLGDGVRHTDRLGGSRRFVEQRGIGDRHAGELADHRLVVDQRLQPALGDLGLIGRVGGVPAGVFQHIPENHRRRVRAIIAEADQAFLRAVAGRERPQLGEAGGLVDRRRQRHRLLGADAGGHGFRRQLVQGGGADHCQHGVDLVLRGGDVAGDEGVLGFEGGELGEDRHHCVSSNLS